MFLSSSEQVVSETSLQSFMRSAAKSDAALLRFLRQTSLVVSGFTFGFPSLSPLLNFKCKYQNERGSIDTELFGLSKFYIPHPTGNADWSGIQWQATTQKFFSGGVKLSHKGWHSFPQDSFNDQNSLLGFVLWSGFATWHFIGKPNWGDLSLETVVQLLFQECCRLLAAVTKCVCPNQCLQQIDEKSVQIYFRIFPNIHQTICDIPPECACACPK